MFGEQLPLKIIHYCSLCCISRITQYARLSFLHGIALKYFRVSQNVVSQQSSSRNTLSKSVAGIESCAPEPSGALRCRGQRKYLTYCERQALAQSAARLSSRQRLLVMLLLWTGARVSEVLAVTARDIDLIEGLVVLRTLKRRRPHMREVPISAELLADLQTAFDLRMRQRNPDLCRDPLFSWSRSTAWRLVRRLCAETKIIGHAASPKGLRHGFGVGALQAGVPLTLVQRWLGHARLTTTAIYTEVVGAEERSFARRFWTYKP